MPALNAGVEKEPPRFSWRGDPPGVVTGLSRV